MAPHWEVGGERCEVGNQPHRRSCFQNIGQSALPHREKGRERRAGVRVGGKAGLQFHTANLTFSTSQTGFTLIELLIVVIILGILAVIGIPKFVTSKREAWAKTCLINRSTLADAAARYQLDVNAYPANQAVLYAITAPSGVSGWKGPYTKKQFNCPATNADTYIFDVTTGEVTCSNLENGRHE
jgi:type II secretion system protein G